MVEKLVGAKRQTALRELYGWIEANDRDAIRKTFHFSDFTHAWGFMSQVALVAERLNHHPEWRNCYNRVEITLSTHDCEGVTTQDVELARLIDQMASERDK